MGIAQLNCYLGNNPHLNFEFLLDRLVFNLQLNSVDLNYPVILVIELSNR